MFPGDYSGGETPVPIPNTEVKPSSADGTSHVLSGRVGRRRDLKWTQFLEKGTGFFFAEMMKNNEF